MGRQHVHNRVCCVPAMTLIRQSVCGTGLLFTWLEVDKPKPKYKQK